MIKKKAGRLVPFAEPEAPTKPSAQNPFGQASGLMPSSRRDPSELVSEREPRASHERPVARWHAPPDEADGEPAATPRPVNGGIALASVPRVVAAPERLVGLPLDHRVGFVLACIDGESTVQTLIDVSGLPPMDVVCALDRLVELGVVVVA